MSDEAALRARGRRAHNWKGGRVVDPRGYVLIYVGKGHPLADVRGYAYEHRLVAQAKNKKPLTKTDIVRHDNRKVGDNDAANLTVTDRLGLGFVRRKRGDLRKPGKANPTAKCACGCGAQFQRYDATRRPRWFISGHNLKGGAALTRPKKGTRPNG